MEPIVPSSESRAEQIGPYWMIREILFLKMCPFLTGARMEQSFSQAALVQEVLSSIPGSRILVSISFLSV